MTNEEKLEYAKKVLDIFPNGMLLDDVLEILGKAIYALQVVITEGVPEND